MHPIPQLPRAPKEPDGRHWGIKHGIGWSNPSDCPDVALVTNAFGREKAMAEAIRHYGYGNVVEIWKAHRHDRKMPLEPAAIDWNEKALELLHPDSGVKDMKAIAHAALASVLVNALIRAVMEGRTAENIRLDDLTEILSDTLPGHELRAQIDAQAVRAEFAAQLEKAETLLNPDQAALLCAWKKENGGRAFDASAGKGI